LILDNSVTLNQISNRAYNQISVANSWEEIWEAGPYFDRLSELLEDAKFYVVFVGWQIDSRLGLKRPSRPGFASNLQVVETLREKVVRLCQEKPQLQIYFLVWDHAYFYVFEREVWQGRIWENVHPRVHFVFDNRHPFGASHHEKAVIIDGRVALCGGIDLCDERWDSIHHFYSDPRRSLTGKFEKHGPYHDLAVQVTGPVCAWLQDHVANRWKLLSSIPFPELPQFELHKESLEGHRVYLSRTIADVDCVQGKKWVTREIEFLFRDLIRSAKKRIILEGQYYWSRIINDLLISKIHQMRGTDFEVILVLADLQCVKSLTRHMMAYEFSLLKELELAAEYAGVKVTVGSPYVCSPPGEGSLPPKPVYIHSKVLVIDERFLGIGSANFATRALRVDTEIHLTLEARSEAERNHIRKVAQAILDHWKIGSNSKTSGLKLREFKPSVELAHLRGDLGRTKSIQLQSFFDPSLPWLFPVKFMYWRILHRSALTTVLLGAGIWLVSIFFAGTVFNVWKYPGNWSFIYSVLLSSVWLIPIPFILTVLLAVIHLGPDLAIRLGVSSLWVAALLGYGLTRIYPTISRHLYIEHECHALSKKLGLRNFKSLISVLFDPRISIRLKIAYQGFYCIPFPWFLLGTGILLPAALYEVLYILSVLLSIFMPKIVFEAIQANVTWFILAMVAVAFAKVLVTLWKNIESE
jgi:phosphatidylserine/phosphatidylglycerophosphate/cardiolipin synthase-like enzyme